MTELHGHHCIVHAARLAGAHTFIEELPEGCDTILCENGANLSGGLRIAIARAFLRDAPILLMDEAAFASGQQSRIRSAARHRRAFTRQDDIRK